MTEQSIINQRFTDGFNKAKKYYKNDDLFKCADLCYGLLEDYAIPRYHKMKTLILLGSVLGDWDESNDCRVAAELLWQTMRRWNPAGKDATTDEAMAEIRELIDDLTEALKAKQPSAIDLEDTIDELEPNHDQEAADAMTVLKDSDIDEQTTTIDTEMKATACELQ
jgi:hypothetical protein